MYSYVKYWINKKVFCRKKIYQLRLYIYDTFLTSDHQLKQPQIALAGPRIVYWNANRNQYLWNRSQSDHKRCDTSSSRILYEASDLFNYSYSASYSRNNYEQL